MKVVAVIAATLGSLLLPLPHEWSAGWRSECLNRMHAPLLGIACIALASGRSSDGLHSLRVALGAVLVSGLVEWLQPWFGRTASMLDFGWGVAGILGGTLRNLAKTRPGHFTRTFLTALAALCMLVPPSAWLAEVGQAILQANRSFPELLDPHGKQLSRFWVVQPNQAQKTFKTEGQIVLAALPERSATAHLDALGNDWSGYTGLELQGELEADTAIEVGIRVDLDDANRTKLRTSGWMWPRQKQLRVNWPEGTQPKKVRQLVIFLAPRTPPTACLTLTRVFLIKEDKDRPNQAFQEEVKAKQGS